MADAKVVARQKTETTMNHIVDKEAVDIARGLLTFVNDKTKYEAFQKYIDNRIRRAQRVLEAPGLDGYIYDANRGVLSELKIFRDLRDIVQKTLDEQVNSK